MADLYAELITNINKTIDPLENGEISVAKSKQATNADTADHAGNCESATLSGTANNVNSASFGNVVADMGIPLVTSCKIINGEGDSCSLSEGVYLAIYVGTYSGMYQRTLCGLLVVMEGKISHCRIAPRYNRLHGATLQYNHKSSFMWLSYSSGGDSELDSTNTDGNVYFYKIGTLEEKG